MTKQAEQNPAGNRQLLEEVAERVGTPYWLVDAATVRGRIADIKRVAEAADVKVRFAVKSCPATMVLAEMYRNGIWIDAVSGNEVLRALHAGYPGGHNPPKIMFTADVFRDDALRVVMENNILPNIGSPGQVQDLAQAGYSGELAMRINPGFGHGHVNACDTGGPSSKHGVWMSQAAEVGKAVAQAGMRVTMLHAHIGSGPRMEELLANLARLAKEFALLAPHFPSVNAVSLGGGIPHTYREDIPAVDIAPLSGLFVEARRILQEALGREIRLEIEPGRHFVAPAATLVGRVTDVKKTEKNEKGEGRTFVMVDAGFVDLARPAMYGSYHRISVPGREGEATQPVVVAGPLCESGDVFTRDAGELLTPRNLPMPRRGDLLCLHDGGAYGYSMASNYNSIGRAPQVWLEEDGSKRLMSRRETVEEILRLEEGPEGSAL